jgi:hypothetical protein
MAEEDVGDPLEVELHCPECGAAIVVGIWDQSAACAYCGSLLACGRVLGEEVFVVSTVRHGTKLDVVELLIRFETESYRNELTGNAKNKEGISLEIPALVEARVALLRAKLEAELEPVDTVDFLVPYELHERTVVQGVLGRRGAAKESFVQCFRTEDLRRRYDEARLNLRDRGLKIRGSRLELLAEAHREGGGDRYLESVDAAPNRGGVRADRARFRVDTGAQVITQIDGVVRERRLSIWKHMSTARVRRAGQAEDYLIDRQFDTIAGRLSRDEASVFRALPERPVGEVIVKPRLRALASECPNCGVDLTLPKRAKIAFCATCALGIRITPDGLETYTYAFGPLAAGPRPDAQVGFPYWSLPFHVRAGGRDYTRVWDWLEAVAPQPAAARFREHDPAQSRLFVPARALLGSRPLDDAFASLCATATWRQPAVRVERASPAEAIRLLDVELEPAEAAALARYTLVALHDAQSTRSLHGMNFKKLVMDAELGSGDAQLVVLPLAIFGGHWFPCPPEAGGDPTASSPGMRPVPLELLEDDGRLPRRSRAFSLA